MLGRVCVNVLIASVSLTAMASSVNAQEADPISAQSVDDAADPTQDVSNVSDAPPVSDDESEQEPTSDGKKAIPRRIPFPVEANTFVDETGAVQEGEFSPHIIQLIEVPLVLQPVDLTQKSDPLWVKGPRPKNNLLATIELAPREQVTVSLPDGETLQLSKVERNKTYGLSPSAPDTLASKSSVYCGKAPDDSVATNLVCFHDTDGNGDFDRAATGLSEASDDHPFAMSAMLPSAKLVSPMPYQNVAEDQLESMTFEYRNCGKDWDRPFYAIGRKNPEAGENPGEIPLDLLLRPIDPETMTPAEMAKIIRLLNGGGAGFQGTCRKGRQIEKYNNVTEANLKKGSILVRMGDLVFSVGSKKEKAPVKLLGSTGSRTFRLEEGAVVTSHTGLSSFQQPIATAQRFDKPTFIASGDVEAADSVVGIGDTAYSAGFEYGYRGKLGETSRIRTILSSRSLKEGTEVYGIPMKSRVVTTYGGSYIGGRFGGNRPGPGNPRGITTRLAWCAPLQKERSFQNRKNEWEKETYWNATCISMVGNQHTLTKNIEPAFGVTRISHNLHVSTNDGNPPIDELGPGAFSQPTRVHFVIDELTKNGLKLKRQIWFGDQLTSEEPHFVREDKVAGFVVDHAAMKVAFVPTEESTLDNPQFRIEVRKAPEAGDAFVFNNSRVQYSFN